MYADDTPQLGLVCITDSDAVRYRALTRKRLRQFDEARQKEMLRELYEDNLTKIVFPLRLTSRSRQ